MKKSRNILIVVCIVLSVIIMMLTIYFVSNITMTNNYKRELSNLYLKNMYNFVDNVADMEVSLSKLMATSSIDTQREILSDIYVSTSNASSNISNLPIAKLKTENVTTLINRLGGFAYSLIQKSYDNQKISDKDYEQLEGMYANTKSLLYDINEYMATTKNSYNILKDIDFKNGDSSEFNAGVYTNESSSSKVPSLIYDGPFSDSVLNKEIKGLSDREYSESECRDLLSKLYPESNIEYLGDSDGIFATYNYNIVCDINMYATVTKMGGLLLNIVSYGENGGINIDIGDGVVLAEEYAKKVGMDNMYSVWTQSVNNVLYVNLAPIVDRVIYYPDLIKVKVDMTRGIVVGWEAKNYAYNHTKRDAFKTTTSILKGDEYLNDRLEVLERNYTIIPNKYVGESKAYEYICSWQDYTYYVYLDPETFEEINIMRVIETTSGSLIE